ncbi:hypothetical protein ANN_10396 [Periplaneta americana]|uniref:Uncharacterized protein n=1 Tax=Periplaneta americana TaxID=6978 RepID=A0ABQ8TSS5_PERAM|nr:hypothetical protein ANN_10396 [Periplaneta americana]
MGSTERSADAVKRWFRSEAADVYDTKIDPMGRGTMAQHFDLLRSIALILKLGGFPNPHRLTTLRFAEYPGEVSGMSDDDDDDEEGRRGNPVLVRSLLLLLSKNLKVRIYGCETWTLTLKEEQRLRVFENKMFRKIFGAKKVEVTGEWRKLHNAELHALRLRWAGHVARMGESRNAYRVLVGRPEGKRPLGRPRRRWEDNIKMDLREVGYDDREWINLAQDRDQWRAYVRAAMNLRVPVSKSQLLKMFAIEWNAFLTQFVAEERIERKVMFYLTTLATAEVISASPDVPEFCPTGVLLHASKSTDMSLSHLSTLKCHRPGPGSNPQPWA